jgi:hypothetical protein
MKNQNHYGFNSGIRFLAFALAMFFAVLAVFDEYEDQGKQERHEESVYEKEFDFAVFPSSLSRPTSSKLTKIERMEVIKTIDWIFDIQISSPWDRNLNQDLEVEFPYFTSVFTKSEVLTNAP